MHIQKIRAQGIRFSIHNGEDGVGRAYLYILNNDLHEEPFGLLEDVFVSKSHRNGGIASQLLNEVLAHARSHNCYKLIATSRTDGTREEVHAWYIRLGFTQYGTEFRMNFSI